MTGTFVLLNIKKNARSYFVSVLSYIDKHTYSISEMKTIEGG
ncbi:hypothetical protein HMPREF0083_04337 [Aneurinibacillus aneurinilyticus ATCC 12856]|uniref:Uncharacterized protein n=1 Tax=Aneurinibacillus aneurinilyticus ATCC 12856 TaxID=649747 RepID=U1Y5U4_ANEAE|nr:hypothetical protein HMPREF0083_04337 [Aneurinibacillus aneurinilyticus ATCC 12856]